MKNIKIYIKGVNRTNDVLRYKNLYNRFLITFKSGGTYTYNIYDVEIVQISPEEIKANKDFSYFRELAKQIGLYVKFDNGRKVNVLESNYEKIEEINSKTILYNFLTKKLPKSKTRVKERTIFGNFFKLIKTEKLDFSEIEICPFGFNISQSKALKNAIDNRLSVIEGPPGTGKTQTILNIIANVIMENKNIAVVSSNNSATKNVIDKFKKYNLDFICAYLGNSQNKQEFIDNQEKLPDMSSWLIQKEELEELCILIKNKYKFLKEMLSKQNELSILKQQLASLNVEYKHYLNFLEQFKNIEIPNEIAKISTCKKALEYSVIFEEEKQPKINKFVEIIKKIIEFLRIKQFKYTIAQKLLKEYSKDYLVAISQMRFYELKIDEIKKSIEFMQSDLEDFDFDKNMKEYSLLSMEVFKSKLAERYLKKTRKKWELSSIQNNSKKFIEDYPVILSTTYSIKNCLSSQFTYDYLIVDEASQVDIATGVLALSCAKSAVVVGDLKQLPNVVDENNSKISDEIFEKYNLSECYRYKNHCLLSSVVQLFSDIPRTLLKEHYRCHPMIIEFCNKKFYNNELIILSDIKTDRKPLVLYKTVKGNLAIDNLNRRQIEVIKNEIIPNENIDIYDGSLGIVTPYRNQTNALQKEFQNTSVKADTVDKFQGQENKIIIISTVDNHIKDFTDNPNRLNVAVSRAIEQLILVINGNEIEKDKNIYDLAQYIKYNNCDVKESKLFSVFDYLYKCYSEERKQYLKKCEKISQYDSENLFYSVLDRVLSKKYENKYGIAVHVTANKIIKDTSLLNAEEFSYISRNWTHVDFLIYDNLSKIPNIAIETDGASFHDINSEQAIRDKMKNEIFKKYNLPLIRFNTKDFVNEEVVYKKISMFLT